MDPNDIAKIDFADDNEDHQQNDKEPKVEEEEEKDLSKLSDAFIYKTILSEEDFQVNDADVYCYSGDDEDEQCTSLPSFSNLNLDIEHLQPISATESGFHHDFNEFSADNNSNNRINDIYEFNSFNSQANGNKNNQDRYFDDALAQSKNLVEESSNWLEFDFPPFNKIREVKLDPAIELLSSGLDNTLDSGFVYHKADDFEVSRNAMHNNHLSCTSDDIVIVDLESHSYENEITITDLPHEILLKIFVFFNQRELCQYIAPVCSSWFNVAKDPTLWTSISCCDYEDVYDDLLIQVILAWCKNLQKLELNRRSELTYHDFKKILLHCPHLKLLSMAFCSQINENVLGLVTEYCKTLTDINIEGCDISDQSFYKLIGLPLTSICVSHCNKLSNDGGIFLANNFKNLTEINFDGIQWITEDFVEILVDQHFVTLEKVYLDGENLTDRAVKMLSKCSNLKCLSFSFCSNMNPQTLDWVVKCNKLDYLKLRKGINFTNKSLLNYLRSIREEQSQKFKYLNLAECIEISDECLFFIAENCPNLEILDLSWCWEVSDDGITFVLDSCHKLKELHLRGLHELYGNTFPRIVRTMPELKFLDLSQCNKVQDELIEHLVRQMRDLIVYNYYGDTVVNANHRKAHLIS